MKITMTVHHGQLIANEQVSADSFEDCLSKLEKTRLYIGYGPNLRENILPLKEKGFLMWGWADFEFSSENPVDNVGDMSDYVSDRFDDLLDR